MKVADAELKGLVSYFNLDMTDLCVPMMALVDYRGFRLIAMSVLPINGHTSLVYGSNDGGNTVHADNPLFNHLMEQAGTRLNLKPHFCGMSTSKGKRLHAAADVEGHVGEDGKFYLVCFDDKRRRRRRR
jgi:Clustered mitochondria